MGVLGVVLETHKVDDVYDPDLELGQLFAQHGHGGHGLERGSVAAAGHYLACGFCRGQVYRLLDIQLPFLLLERFIHYITFIICFQQA